MNDSPVTHVSLRPLAARWFAQRPGTIRELRNAAGRARLAGRPALAEQLEEASEQLRAILAFRSGSGSGSPEEADVEVVPDSERAVLLGTAEVAVELGVSDSWVRHLIRTEALGAIQVGKRYGVSRSEVDAFRLLRSSHDGT